MKTSDISISSTTPTARRSRAVGVVDSIEMSDSLSVQCVDTTDVVAVDTAHTKDVLSADATDFMSAHTTQSLPLYNESIQTINPMNQSNESIQ